MAQRKLFPAEGLVPAQPIADDPPQSLTDDRFTGLIREVSAHSVSIVVVQGLVLTLHGEFLPAFGGASRAKIRNGREGLHPLSNVPRELGFILLPREKVVSFLRRRNACRKQPK